MSIAANRKILQEDLDVREKLRTNKWDEDEEIPYEQPWSRDGGSLEMKR